MPKRAGQKRFGLLFCSLYGVLSTCAAIAQDEFPIADAIAPSCAPVEEYPGNAQRWQERRFPDSISVEIAGSKQRKWIENLLKTLTSRKKNIPPSARKNFDATVSWELNGQRCESKAKVRLNGDAKDHISYTGNMVISSVVVKLLDGHVGNSVRFKLLLPETRAGDRELIAIQLFREFGFLAPESRIVTGYLNGIETEYLFQEIPAKEFMEANALRESVLVEGDERWGWLMHSRPDVYSEKLVHDAVWVENRSFGRADNRGWIANPVATDIAIAGLTLANQVYHAYHVDKPHRVGDEDHLGMSSSFRLDQNSEIIEKERLFVLLSKVLYASHGLRLHNRKFYFDPMYQMLKPIYYDGMPLRGQDNYLGLFPRNGTFPESEIDMVIDKLSDGRVRNRVFREVVSRGATIGRKEFEDLLDIALSRTRALEPRHATRPAEPPPVRTLDLNLLLEQENGADHYEFFGFDIAAEAFRHCIFTGDSFSDPALTCEGTSMTPKDILSEPIAENGDPIPFVGAFGQRDLSTLRFSTPLVVRERKLLNPQSLDISVDIDELLIIEYTNTYIGVEPPVVKVSVRSDGLRSGKVMVIGDVPARAYFEVSGTKSGVAGLTRYDQRLLTGCLTFVDANFEGVKVVSKLGACEDSVNFVRSKGTVTELLVMRPLADAVDADFSDLQFDRIEISESDNDCIDLSAGTYRISQFNVSACADKGLSVGEKAVVFIDNFVATDANIAAAVKDSSFLSIGSAAIESVKTCFAAYRKKQEFDGARLALGDKVPSECTPDKILIQPGSIMTIGSM
jgi:hypothetical protein